MPYSNPTNNITAPPGATTGSRIVLGPDMPAVLNTFAPANFHFDAAELYYYNDTNFYFIAVGTDFVAGTSVRVAGLYNGTNVIILEITHPSPNNVLYGSTLNGVNGVNWFWEDGTGTITLSATFKTQIATPSGTESRDNGRGIVSCSYWTGGVAATSVAGAEAALVAWSSVRGDVTFAAGRLYRIDVRGYAFSTTATAIASEVVSIRIRSAVNSTAAQVLGTTRVGVPGQSSQPMSFNDYFYVKNTLSPNLDKTTLGITAQRILGANNQGVAGDATFPLIVTVTDIGLAADSTLGTIALEVT
jgi:hypothetical protein